MRSTEATTVASASAIERPRHALAAVVAVLPLSVYDPASGAAAGP
ncbi:hypothetical protein MBEHAL_2650 [Halarchaeum acidiphilum MH1-52-1]|uniref:Uncharacterized protein n=1 Tax=Halarchaeum acidiphilum MH1-52-1 TaxID=1261545 RepID=U2YXV9_9EURY|nr:hypothetical protein [Halarchaeum acidiphilum]GAD53890.1 hypothetical protein MBEHAL_2650 [Halarchaeum acidiphilum MH1-52-1]